MHVRWFGLILKLKQDYSNIHTNSLFPYEIRGKYKWRQSPIRHYALPWEGSWGGAGWNSLALGMFFKLVFPLFSSGTFCTYLCHFWWLDLLDFEEITQCQKSYCHSAYTDHKDHKRRSTADVNLQVLQQVYVEHYSDCSPENKEYYNRVTGLCVLQGGRSHKTKVWQQKMESYTKNEIQLYNSVLFIEHSTP